MRGAILVIAALACVACGAGGAPADHRALWVAEPPAPQASSPLGGAVVQAAQAMMAAAQKGNVDRKWTCGEPASDLRGTTADAATAIAPLGASARLMTAAVVVTFASPAGAFDPQEVPDYPGSGDARVFLQARASVSPDGTFAWTDLKAYLSALQEPAKGGAEVGTLIDPLKVDFEKLLEGASSGKCDVHIMTGEDLDHLPYELDRHERALVLAKLGILKNELPRICKRVGMAKGPWEARVSHVEAVFKSAGTGAKLTSKVTLVGGAPCLGPVDVVAVGEM